MAFLYYSAQTTLAHRISERYFKGKFFVYCAEVYDSENPDSSSPAKVYQVLRAIAEKGDRGHPKFDDHKQSLKAVALDQFVKGNLNQDEYDAMIWEIKQAETRDFAPIIYLILRSAVTSKIAPVPVAKRASPDSEEFTIAGMVADDFEMIRPRLALVGGF